MSSRGKPFRCRNGNCCQVTAVMSPDIQPNRRARRLSCPPSLSQTKKVVYQVPPHMSPFVYGSAEVRLPEAQEQPAVGRLLWAVSPTQQQLKFTNLRMRENQRITQ